jgi:hypothetical protein
MTSTAQANATATEQARETATAEVIATSTAQANATATEVAQQSQTPTSTPAYALSGMGKAVLGPVPVPRNGNLCLYPDKPLVSSQWDVYNFVGESVAHTAFGSETRPCWNTSGISPGLYSVRLKLAYLDGTTGTTWQKVLVSK